MTSQLREHPATGLSAGRGRGPGRPREAQPQSGRCPVRGCSERIDSSRLMCRGHWYQVPKPLRDEVWATWRSGRGSATPEHRETVRRALAALRNS